MSARSPPQALILLVGAPGSGKSWFARGLDSNKFEVLNRDALGWSYGDLLARLFPAKGAPRTGRHVVADLCNHLRKKRQHMIDEAVARGMQVVLVYFDIPEDIRLARMYDRLHAKEPHPSVNDEATALKVHQYFQKEFQPPISEEWTRHPPRAVIPIRITTEEEVGKHLLTFNSRQ